MTKHTPGPWSVAGQSITSLEPQVNGQGWDNTGFTDQYYNGGYLIAESIVNPANAHLIASAPDLLEALEDILDQLKHIKIVIGLGFDESKIHAAIAKARG